MTKQSKIMTFPNTLTLEKLEGSPVICDVPVLFGLDSVPFRTLSFSIECDFEARAILYFDCETYEYETIDIWFNGIEKLTFDELNDLDAQTEQEEFLIVCQASEILLEHKDLHKYLGALEKYLENNYDEK